jgi:hypothetical protein
MRSDDRPALHGATAIGDRAPAHDRRRAGLEAGVEAGRRKLPGETRKSVDGSRV